MNSTTALVTVFFTLSLVGAVLLFRFLKSSALIRSKTYQAGGALAGFVIIFAVLSGFYYKVETLQNATLKKQVEELATQLKKLELDTVSGEVEPDRQPVKVRLVFDAVEPDSEGKFKFQVPRVLLESPTAALYAITDDDHVILDANCDEPPCQLPESSRYLYAEKLNEIKIPMRLKRK